MAQYRSKQSKKKSKSHKTYIAEAKKVAVFLGEFAAVTKVVCAATFGKKPMRTRGLAIHEEKTGLKISVYGSAGCQIVYVHTKEPDKIRSCLIEKFGERQ